MPHRSTGKGELPANRDVAMTKYTYVRGLAHSALASCGTMRWDGAQVEPQVTDSLLREFLTLLETTQEELNQRWSDQEKSGCHADRA